jgi:hypothetical protein
VRTKWKPKPEEIQVGIDSAPVKIQKKKPEEIQ